MSTFQNARPLLLTVLGSALGAVLVLGGARMLPHDDASVVKGDFSAALSPFGSQSVIVMRKGCPACGAAKQWLSETNLTPRIIYIDDDPQHGKELLALVKVDAVPTLITGDRAVVGFGPESWAKALQR